MNYNRCVYFVEGRCEEQLINALKAEPRRLTPGRVKVHNIVQEEISRWEMNMIQPGTTVVFVFDTDVEKSDVLLKNVSRVKHYASRTEIVYLAQVLNFEDEIERATDVRKAQDLTRSSTVSDFKADFCKMKMQECRNALERHQLDVSKLWASNPPAAFSFISQNGNKVKIR